ncbi:MAG: hypothetical protein ABGX07_05925, partial [Pirellulaceae bacterium]
KNSNDVLERTAHVSIAHRTVAALASSSKPLAQLGLQLVTLLDEPKHENRNVSPASSSKDKTASGGWRPRK